MHNSGMYYCFSCQAKGWTIFQFAAHVFHLRETRWRSILAKLYPYFFGNAGTTQPPLRTQIKQEYDVQRKHNNLLAAKDYARGNFHHDETVSLDWEHFDNPAKIYMGRRGLLGETLDHFH